MVNEDIEIATCKIRRYQIGPFEPYGNGARRRDQGGLDVLQWVRSQVALDPDRIEYFTDYVETWNGLTNSSMVDNRIRPGLRHQWMVNQGANPAVVDNIIR